MQDAAQIRKKRKKKDRRWQNEAAESRNYGRKGHGTGCEMLVCFRLLVWQNALCSLESESQKYWRLRRGEKVYISHL